MFSGEEKGCIENEWLISSFRKSKRKISLWVRSSLEIVIYFIGITVRNVIVSIQAGSLLTGSNI